MSLTINLEARLELRDEGWWVTRSVNGSPGLASWGPFAVRVAADEAAKVILRDMAEELERAKTDSLHHLRGLLQ
ncbi:hypothetical protein BOSEA31B_13864 [Hyphomicrobiales bacterium]|nr:hypothetical protein BOSEA31B_13864 [Hyphomicrobiales bacterium]CAH1699639.1 hypothetical protein BOSEA1005_12692 [Hyphomicrobiales bacterium]CAI0343373.1 hypothetical protein BO1005MUT1_240017 [Hyphomicrobiales bacterium]